MSPPTGRPSGARRTAFVLGGARNLGAMQVGMLAALSDVGVTPDLVVGCSVGAVNGAAIAASGGPVEPLADVWAGLERRDVWSLHPVRVPLALLRRGAGASSAARLRAVLDEHLPERFEELAVPFHCVAADLGTGRARWFSSGPLRPAVLASAALPGLLPPVALDGATYVDGAAVDVVPVARAIALGANRLFVLQIRALDDAAWRPRRPLDVVLRAFAISRNARFLAELDAVPVDIEVHVLPVVPWARLRYDGFSRTGELIASARSAATAHLAATGITG